MVRSAPSTAQHGLLLALLVLTGAAHACKYSVRDVAFVDLDGAPYEVVVIAADDEGGERFRRAVLRATTALFADTNLVFAPSADATGTLEDHLDAHGLDWPRGSTLALLPPGRPLRGSGRPPLLVPVQDCSDEGVWKAVERLVHSPLREEILTAALEAHSVILVVEGTDGALAERAREVVERAAAHLGNHLHRMAKPVATGPRILVLPQSRASDESTLLDSLGIPRNAVDTHVAVLYGRGRPMGELLLGAAITQQDLLRLLTLIGEDCECGLDRSQLNAPAFPQRWDRSRQEAAAAALGFDPENPRIRAEIARIIARGATGSSAALPPTSDALFGYREALEPAAPDRNRLDPGDTSAAETRPVPVSSASPTTGGDDTDGALGTPAPPRVAEPPGSAARERPSPLVSLWPTFLAVAALSIAGALVVVLRAKRSA